MLKIYTPAQIEQFKRDASRLARSNSLTHAEALNQIAAAHGYANWSLLSKLATSHQTAAISTRREIHPHLFLRTTEEMRQAMRKKTQDPGNGSPSRKYLRTQVKDLSAQFVSPKNALEFAITYMERALQVARFSVHAESLAYIEMRCWLPYCLHVVSGNTYVLLGRDYKPVGMVQRDDRVNYSDFPQTHMYVTKLQLLQQCTAYRHDGAEGYFYDASPWGSRRAAQTYLDYLKKLLSWQHRRLVSQV